jgi:hypothetical protein
LDFNGLSCRSVFQTHADLEAHPTVEEIQEREAALRSAVMASELGSLDNMLSEEPSPLSVVTPILKLPLSLTPLLSA